MLYRRISLLVAAFAIGLPTGANAASTATVSGKVTGSGAKGARVMALSTRGQAVTATAKSGGTFSLKVPSANVNGLSLQLLAADGSYLGPVVLYAKGSKGATRLSKISGKTLKLGTIKLKKGYGQLSKALPTKSVLLKGTGAVKLTNGVPVGAGRLGLPAAGTAKASQSGGGTGGGGGGGTPGGSCTSDQSVDAGGGGDCDRDGVPNVVDVDDNGNGSLDAVDIQSAQTTAKLNLFFSMRPHFKNQTNVYGGATRASINAFLGATGEEAGLNLNFFLNQRYLDPLSDTAFSDVWLGCSSGQPWCAAGSPTAVISGLSDVPPLQGTDRFAQIPWFGYHGSDCDSSACTPRAGSNPNALAKVNRGGDPLPSWIGSVRPGAADTFATVVPGDVMTINASRPDGTVIAQPTTISPYFVTSPAIASYGTPGGEQTTVPYPISDGAPGTNQSTAVTVDASGKMQVRFWRPQRFALPGESGEFYDMGGLRYGVTVESYNTQSSGYRPLGRPAACPVSDLSGLTEIARTNEFETATMRDASSTDTATNAADASSRTIGFTVDVKACLAAAGAPTDSGVGTLLSIGAKGEDFPGGANATGMDMEVRLP